MDQNIKPSILRLRDVKAVTGLSRSTIYARAARAEFPSQIKLGDRAVGWLEHEIVDWLRQQITASRSGTG